MAQVNATAVSTRPIRTPRLPRRAGPMASFDNGTLFIRSKPIDAR